VNYFLMWPVTRPAKSSLTHERVALWDEWLDSR
jgi:hypothetical protein